MKSAIQYSSRPQLVPSITNSEKRKVHHHHHPLSLVSCCRTSVLERHILEKTKLPHRPIATRIERDCQQAGFCRVVGSEMFPRREGGPGSAGVVFPRQHARGGCYSTGLARRFPVGAACTDLQRISRPDPLTVLIKHPLPGPGPRPGPGPGPHFLFHPPRPCRCM